ncbi:MAG TPA: hypothetical protein DCY89_05470 [Gammaproteobacteria bacterium]|nr:hypothetical protein [Gammaproteobacteria bacterium]
MELSRIADATGALTPALVVEAATDPESPLHDAFDWDDSAAAHKYRLVQARSMIRSVRFVRGDIVHHEYTNVLVERSPMYVRTEALADKPNLLAQALERAHRRHAECEHEIRSLLAIAESEPGKDTWVLALNTTLSALAVARESMRALH